MLVGMIVVATLTGFDVVNRTSADQRQRNQAAALAALSQGQLRSDPASVLATMQATPHTYKTAVAQMTYTIEQKAALLPAGGSTGSCSVTETKRQSGNAFSITSTVTWPQQQKSKRPAVVASSVITPPTGSALEVDANNAPTPTAGVSGVTAIVQYTPVGTITPVTLEQTTGSGGCVVFAGIPATSAIVEIAETPGYVTRSGASQYPPKEVTLAPNFTTHYAVLYNRGGAINAAFTYKGSPTYKHTNNEGTGELAETVTGDTFVALNTKMTAAPNFELGSTRYGLGTVTFEPLPGAPGAYEASATSKSNLFPFLESESGNWSVYAGDCTENNAETISAGSIKLPEKVYVNPGATTTASVPTSYVTLNLYKGTQAEVKAPTWSYLETTTHRAVTIANTKCAGVTPDNEAPVNVKHTQETTVGTLNGGHLEDPFQPLGKEYALCVFANGKTFIPPKYENKEAKGGTLSIYLGQKSTQEKATLKTEALKTEAEVKAAREATEKEAKTKRQAEEAVPRTKAEEKEAAERAQWLKERSEGKITASQRTAKENTQTTNREARVKVEAETRAKAEAAETAAREPKVKEELTTAEARTTREAAEATEAATTKVVVETSAKCP
jgi:hypothetical protein